MEELYVFGMPLEIWAYIGPLIGGLVGALVTLYTTNSKIRAELISKSRIAWINEVRRITADILEEIERISSLNMKYEKILKRNKYLDPIEKSTYEERFNEIGIKLEKNINLYKLYFPMKEDFNLEKREDDENQMMHFHAARILNEYTNLQLENKPDENGNYFSRNYNVTIDFINATSKYTKKEWDKAKKNK